MGDPLTTDPEADRARLLKYFPAEGELPMQLLKGHLALEQSFRELLDLYLPKPERLRGEKGTSLDSHAVICLVDALTPNSFPHPWAFAAAKKLNKARNSLAHRIEDTAFEAQCADFVHFVKESQPEFAAAMRDDWKVRGESEFSACIGGLCSVIAHLKPYAATSRREV
jgi:hypothetical protein